MKRSGVIGFALVIGFGLLVIVGVGAAGWSPEKETIDVGPGPMARLNRFLALERYLEQRYDCTVDSRFSIAYGTTDEYYDLIILPVEALPLHEDQWHQLDALQYEGSLVITGFGDYHPEGGLPSQYETPGILARIGVEALNPSTAEEPAHLHGEAGFGDYNFVSFFAPEFVDQPDPEAPFGRAPGVFTLQALDVLANEEIGMADHVLWLESLVAPLELGAESRVLIVHGRFVASLWSWLADEGLPAVLLTVLLVGLLIWHYGPRFGPLLPGPETGSRELREHFLATSRFFWRTQSSSQLLAPARRPLLEALRRRVGQAGEAEIAALGARLSGQDPAAVREALFSQEINKRTLVTATRVLQKMRQYV